MQTRTEAATSVLFPISHQTIREYTRTLVVKFFTASTVGQHRQSV